MADQKSRFVLDADSDGYQQAVKEAEQSTKSLTKSQQSAARSAKASTASFDKLSKAFSAGRQAANTFAKVALAAGTALTTGLVKSGLSSVDTLAKTSDKLGVTTEALAGLRFAAEQTGVAQNALDVGLQRFTRRLADAAAGTGPAVAAFDALGLSAEELVKLSPDEALGKVADKMRTVENQSQKVSLAFKLFDSEGVSLVNTLEAGSGGLDEFARQADVAGVAINRIDAAKVEAANDAINRVATGFKGFTQQLAVQFAPVLTAVADRLFGIGKESGGMAKAAGKAFDFIIKAVGVFGDGLRGIHVILKGLKAAWLNWAAFVIKRFDSVARAATNLANLIPGVNIDYENSTFAQFVTDLEANAKEAFNEFHELAMEPIPSQALEQFVDDAERSFTAGAEAAVNAGGIIQTEMIETAEVTEALATKTEKATEKIESAWDKALKDTASRIDSDFSSAWRDALDGNVKSFQDFSSNIIDAAKGLFAELLHLNITRPLVQGIGGAFGLGAAGTAGASSGVTAGSGFSGLAGNALGLLNGGIGGFAGLYESAGTFLSNAGFTGAGDAAYNAALRYGGGTTLQNLGNIGLSAGAGLLGGYAGNKIFGGGGYSNIGATLGGFAGSIFGPLGTGVGSFLGSGVGSLFGGNNDGDNKGRGVLDFGASSFDVAGVGKSFNDENVSAVQAVTEQLVAFADSIGGSTAQLEITRGNNSGFRLGGERFGNDVDALLDEAYKQIIAGADQLEGRLRDMALAFQGTAEQTALYLQSLTALEQLSDLDPVADAIEAFTAAQPTLLRAYNDQADGIAGLIANYDGTAEATAGLASALAANRQAAYEFALSIQAIGASIAETAENQAKSIRESLLTDEQLREARVAERNSLREQLGTLTDPEEIARVSERILTLNRQVFDALDEASQQAFGENFANYAEQTSAAANAALDVVLTDLQASQKDINAQMQDFWQENAQIERQTANLNRQAAADFGAWVRELVSRGITVEAIVRNVQSEVNA